MTKRKELAIGNFDNRKKRSLSSLLVFCGG